MSVKLIINCNTSVKLNSESQDLLSSKNIPYEISGDMLYFYRVMISNFQLRTPQIIVS